MPHSWLCVRCWIILVTVAGLLGGATAGHSQADNPNAGSDVVGRVIAPTSAMGFVGVPPTEREAIRGNFERLWSVALRNPALNPPKGFDLKPELTANGMRPREPVIYIAGGYPMEFSAIVFLCRDVSYDAISRYSGSDCWKLL